MTADQLRKWVDITFDFFFSKRKPADRPPLDGLSKFYEDKM